MPTPEPTITAEIDRLIDDMEDVGVRWYVLGGTANPGPCLAFELPSNETLPEYAIVAMMKFERHFRTNAEIRQATIEWAMSIGAAYQEFGNTAPVWGIGTTKQ